MDNIREIITGTDEKKFKKSVLGYDKKEIDDYILTLEQTFKGSVANYEKKLAEQGDALSMALREKEKLTEKNAELEKKVSYLSSDVEEEKSRLIAENNALKEENTQLSELESRNSLLASNLAELSAKCELTERERDQYKTVIAEKDEIIAEQCRKNAEAERNLKTEMEKLKVKIESERKIQLHHIALLKEHLAASLAILEKL